MISVERPLALAPPASVKSTLTGRHHSSNRLVLEFKTTARVTARITGGTRSTSWAN